MSGGALHGAALPCRVMHFTRFAATLLLPIAGCSGNGSKGKEPPPAPEPQQDAAVAGQALPGEDASPPLPDASTDPVNLTAAADQFWKKGQAACPAGTQLAGAAPPAGRQVYCSSPDGMHGPAATFSEDGKLVELGSYDGGKREGLWVTFHPDGKKSSEAAFHRGNLHGPATRWHPSGAKAEEGTYRDGRPDGTFRVWSSTGKELGSFTIRDGNGTHIAWHDSGGKSLTEPMVDGQAHGTGTYWHPNGTKAEEGQYLRGARTGRWTSWDEQGRKRSEGEYRASNMEGPWTYWDEQGRIARVDTYRRSMMVESIIYQDGQPLTQPARGACRTDDEVRAAYAKATGRQLGGRDHPGCIERAVHFPGIVFVGDFAHDRGCMGQAALIDCAVARLDPAAVLARAGWAKARPELREKIALDYLREIAFVWDGSISDQPKPPSVTREPDGGITIDLWLTAPSGMQRGVTRHHHEYRFSASGTITSKKLETVTTDH